ncbi:MAG: hypothetical protein R3C19_13705 [Planctomycetaceae bacterium]
MPATAFTRGIQTGAGSMIDFDYLHKGLYGLANAHKASALAGHLGAAVAAGYFWGEDNSDLDEAVHLGVERELDRIIKGEEAIWFNAKKAGITSHELFEPLADEAADEKLIPVIAQALAENIGGTRQSGHNVIFASIAIRALHDHPEYATPAMVEGIRKLIRGFNGATAGRGYYGKERGWLQGEQVTVATDDGFELYQSEQEMVEVVIDELISSVAIRRQGFGSMWHIINHTAGLTELSRFGYEELARQGFEAHRHHIRLWRTLPDVASDLGPLQRSEHDPGEPAYWTGDLKRDEARLTHRIKTLYGFHTILRFIEDAQKRKKAEDSLRFLMA